MYYLLLKVRKIFEILTKVLRRKDFQAGRRGMYEADQSQ